MSDVVEYRFSHSGRREKMPVPAGSSVSVADLDNHIKNVDLATLGPRRLAESVLLFYEPHTGEEYAEDSARIPAGATVTVRLLTMWSSTFQASKRAAEFRRLAAEAASRRAAKKEAAAPPPPTQQERKRSFWHFLKPPEGYVCHRCGVPGHYIQACPTNGDPAYDRVRPGGGGSCGSSEGVVSCCSSHSSGGGKLGQGSVVGSSFGNTLSSCSRGASSPAKSPGFPAELLCPLCSAPMKEAVLARCCFRSFCASCISARMVATSTCNCGAAAPTSVADGIVPNKTLRLTIARALAASKSSSLSSAVAGFSSSTVTEEGDHHRPIVGEKRGRQAEEAGPGEGCFVSSSSTSSVHHLKKLKSSYC